MKKILSLFNCRQTETLEADEDKQREAETIFFKLARCNLDYVDKTELETAYREGIEDTVFAMYGFLPTVRAERVFNLERRKAYAEWKKAPAPEDEEN